MVKKLYITAGLLAGLVSVTACSGTQAALTPTVPVTSVSTVGTPAGEPDPNATESSPPGDIPDNTAFVPYRTKLYEIKVPEGWARTDLPAGTSFTDKLNSVKIELRPAASAPTAETAKQEVRALQSAGGNFTLKKIETVGRKGGQAVRLVYQVDSPPNPVTGKVIRDDAERYEFSGNGQEAVLTLSGPAGSDNVDPWRLVSDSFTWL
ncbi:hypothetical protein SAMN05216276_103513 [Streptosporangium subroseum]|uniref:Lipoprotein n=1 Tax=Streptosporangium subroseum TaxID=106412 RepID=A0A239LV22_9ACTN|nr:hypothetical protein [Streptosporangium subroseum]SNT33718.1 hypothetical protein SAMN05216276_103513 [Streptosporangium subroseum]